MFSNNLPTLLKFSNSVNVFAPALSFPNPNVAAPTGSKKICASISKAPVMLLYAAVPGSIISSTGLNNQRPIVTVGLSPASSNLSARSPVNCIASSAFFLCCS